MTEMLLEFNKNVYGLVRGASCGVGLIELATPLAVSSCEWWPTFLHIQTSYCVGTRADSGRQNKWTKNSLDYLCGKLDRDLLPAFEISLAQMIWKTKTGLFKTVRASGLRRTFHRAAVVLQHFLTFWHSWVQVEKNVWEEKKKKTEDRVYGE